MAYYINNLALADNYAAASTLGPFGEADTCTVLVSGNPANMQFYVGDEATGHWTDEREYTAAAGPSTTNSFKVSNVRGIRMRNANAGNVAVVSATLFRTGATYDSWDPIFEAGSLSPGTITASGSVSPGGANVEVDHNGVPISTEPKIDFEDAKGLSWTIADDPANTRAKVTAVPNNAAARIYAAGRADAIPNLAWTTVALPNIDYDTDASMVATANEIVIPSAGIYAVTFEVLWSVLPTQYANLQALRNGVNIASGPAGSGAQINPGQGYMPTFADIVQLAAGDVLTGRVYQNAGGQYGAGVLAVAKVASL